jgi:hypothetical protein
MTDIVTSGSDAVLFAELLTQRGWRTTTERQGLYRRMVPAGERAGSHQSLLIPINPDMSDYTELLDTAVYEAVETFHLAPSLGELRALLGQLSGDDVIRFAKESSYSGGEISWSQGEAVISSMRQSLTASAKATAERASYYGHRMTGVANRYLDHVRMGQTEVGSFVVTAHARPTTSILVEAAAKGLPQTFITSAEISTTLANSLQVVRSCIDDGRDRSAQRQGWQDTVADGVSAELVTALMAATKSPGSLATIVSRAGAGAQRLSPSSSSFGPDDHPALVSAANVLATASPKREVSLTGRVNIVRRPGVGEAGIINVEVQSGTTASQVRVRLTETQFALASRSIVEERFLKVHGTQEQERSTFWIYNPELEIAEKIPRGTVSD